MTDHDDIARLTYRYLRTLDSKDWDGFEACFLPEATGDYRGLVFDDRPLRAYAGRLAGRPPHLSRAHFQVNVSSIEAMTWLRCGSSDSISKSISTTTPSRSIR